jgi:hypothetical protein
MKFIVLILLLSSCTTLSPNYNKDQSHNKSMQNRNKEVMRFTKGMIKHTSKTRRKASGKKHKKNKKNKFKRFVK